MAVYPITNKEQLLNYFDELFDKYITPAMNRVRNSGEFDSVYVDSMLGKLSSSLNKIAQEEYEDFKDGDVTYGDEIEFIQDIANGFTDILEELKEVGEEKDDPEYLVAVEFIKVLKELIV